jgi:hypothetical protein
LTESGSTNQIRALTKNSNNPYDNKYKNKRDAVISNKIHPNATIETPDLEGGEAAQNKVRSDMIEAKPNYKQSLRIISLDNED